MNTIEPETPESKYQEFRLKLKCSFTQVDQIFDSCMDEATALLTEKGIREYLRGATITCMIGQGAEPVLIFLEEIPSIASRVGEAIIPLVRKTIRKISRSPNRKSIPAFIKSLSEASRRLGTLEKMQRYFDLVVDMDERTSKSHYDHSAMHLTPSLTSLLERIPYLLSQLTIDSLSKWVEYGIRNYHDNPEDQRKFFSMESADSRAMFDKERSGTLFIDHERRLRLYLQGLWNEKEPLIPYLSGWDELRKPIPFYNKHGLRVPDVFDDLGNISGLDRYRAVLAHMIAHRRWSTAIVADGFDPFQRSCIEILEDSRVEYLGIKVYPGLRALWIALHPAPLEDACDMNTESCFRHRLTVLSYAILNPDHSYKNKDIIDFSQQFRDRMADGNSSLTDMVSIADSFITKTSCPEDQLPRVHFKDTVVSYRDDNRHLWIYADASDDDEEEQVTTLESQDDNNEKSHTGELIPCHYPEWDYKTQTYRLDWTSVYESQYHSGNAQRINKILAEHSVIAKRLKRILDLLKPQNYVRVRYQEEGSELDLDMAIRSLIDFQGGAGYDPRINMDHKNDGRDVAVTLLIDLSASVNDVPKGCAKSILELSREATTLLAWAIEKLGDPFSIGGFFSDTRHDVRYFHLKSFTEHFNEEVKGRLSAMEAGLSTRMGAAIRHAGYYLEKQKADKKLLLVLTDGEPCDVDVADMKLLIKDTNKAVGELDRQGIYTYCISLDSNADDYVTKIFGSHYSVIDHLERLPEKLPELFLALTK